MRGCVPGWEVRPPGVTVPLSLEPLEPLEPLERERVAGTSDRPLGWGGRDRPAGLGRRTGGLNPPGETRGFGRGGSQGRRARGVVAATLLSGASAQRTLRLKPGLRVRDGRALTLLLALQPRAPHLPEPSSRVRPCPCPRPPGCHGGGSCKAVLGPRPRVLAGNASRPGSRPAIRVLGRPRGWAWAWREWTWGVGLSVPAPRHPHTGQVRTQPPWPGPGMRPVEWLCAWSLPICLLSPLGTSCASVAWDVGVAGWPGRVPRCLQREVVAVRAGGAATLGQPFLRIKARQMDNRPSAPSPPPCGGATATTRRDHPLGVHAPHMPAHRTCPCRTLHRSRSAPHPGLLSRLHREVTAWVPPEAERLTHLGALASVSPAPTADRVLRVHLPPPHGQARARPFGTAGSL